MVRGLRGRGASGVRLITGMGQGYGSTRQTDPREQPVRHQPASQSRTDREITAR